jgi:hypothetical protein
MKFKLLSACALFLLVVSSASAQAKTTTSGKCEKPTVQSIPVGDMDGHMYVIQSGTCAPKNEVHGAKATSASFAEHGDMSGTHTKTSGVYTETFDSGDKLFYSYNNTGTVKDGAFTTGSNTYKIIGGTGKMKGMKGSGSCKLKGTDDGGLTYNCTGEMASAMSKKAAPAETK